jgi:hypothetical protein
MNGIAVVVLLISLISISAAAAPTAKPDLYQAQCGVVLSVPAPGLLANDLPSGKITVSTFTAPSAGTLTVDPSGSFVYTPPQNSIPGGYATFYYKETDGTSVSNQVLVKIAVSCQCKGAAPNVDVCLGTKITSDFLASQGAGCIGCKDATPKFDLSKIPAQPVAGCYPYTVTCPSCNVVTGQVCFHGPCTITWVPFTVCSETTPTVDQIKDSGKVKCSSCGDTDPAISDPIRVGDHWEYTITCQSICGSATATGTVNIDESCTPTIEVAFPIPVESCLDHTLPTPEEIKENGVVSCGCGGTLEISDIHWIQPVPSESDEWVGEYTATCRSANGCEASDQGQFTSAECGFDCGALDCDDGNVCTDDSCTPETGCVHTANSKPCDDGNACTTGDVCADGSCTSGTPKNCDDGNVCTDDSCTPATGCVYTANSKPCDDGDVCTTGDVCADNECKPGTAVVCNGGDLCSGPMTCDSDLGGCVAGTPKNCDDKIDCTTDSCNPTTGACTHTPDNTQCDDGNVCTRDACSPINGCIHANVATGTDCSSGNCVSAATCQPVNACAGVAYCTPASGSTNTCPNNLKCCAQSDTCVTDCSDCITSDQCKA